MQKFNMSGRYAKQADPKVRLNDSSLTGADYVAV